MKKFIKKKRKQSKYWSPSEECERDIQCLLMCGCVSGIEREEGEECREEQFREMRAEIVITLLIDCEGRVPGAEIEDMLDHTRTVPEVSAIHTLCRCSGCVCVCVSSSGGGKLRHRHHHHRSRCFPEMDVSIQR